MNPTFFVLLAFAYHTNCGDLPQKVMVKAHDNDEDAVCDSFGFDRLLMDGSKNYPPSQRLIST
jgi:hypothetical protein